MSTIQELATAAAANFETGHRDPQPDSGSVFRRFKMVDGYPAIQWCQELSKAAHDDGNIWPDDHRFAMIEGALDAIADAGEEFNPDEPTEVADNFARGHVDGQSHFHILDWLASDTRRLVFCDDGADEMGRDGDLIHAITWGWRCEAMEVFHQVLRFLENQADD